MTATPAEREAYINEYLENLPPECRPTQINKAINESLANAYRMGWRAKYLAQATSATAVGARSPVAIAVHRLQALCRQKPPTTYVPRNFEPIIRAPKLPDDLLAERKQVFKRLMAGQITETEATEAIADIYARFVND